MPGGRFFKLTKVSVEWSKISLLKNDTRELAEKISGRILWKYSGGRKGNGSSEKFQDELASQFLRVAVA